LITADPEDFFAPEGTSTLIEEFEASSTVPLDEVSPEPGSDFQNVIKTKGLSGSSSSIIYISLSVAAVVILSILSVVVYLRYRGKNLNDNEKPVPSDNNERTASTFTSKFDSSSNTNTKRKLKLKLIVKLDSGGFGEVWKGKYMGEHVAVKMILKSKLGSSNKFHLVKMMTEEAELMHQLKHSRIGICSL
jgi:hypothetical protein